MGGRVKAYRFASDERLVGAARAGDERAYERIYERHARELLSFCRHMLGSQSDAEDAVQQTFLKAFPRLAESRRPIAIRPWLFTIARHECISMLRRARVRVPDPAMAEPAVAGLSTAVERREELRELMGDIAALPDEQRAALILSSLDALPGAEIAEVLDTDAHRVKALVFRARRSLAQARDARSANCTAIRAELSHLRGGSLRRGDIRAHLLGCEGCREFRLEVRRQRQLVGALLPVPLPLALKGLCLPGVAAGAKGASAAGAAGGSGIALFGHGGIVAGAGGKLAVGAAGLAVLVAAGGPGKIERAGPAPAGATPAQVASGEDLVADYSEGGPGGLSADGTSREPRDPGGARADVGRPGGGSPHPGSSEDGASNDASGGAGGTAGSTPAGGPPAGGENLGDGASGPPADAGPPDHSGAPEHAGPPSWAGPPSHAGPPPSAGPPADAGPPSQAGGPHGAPPGQAEE